MNNASILVIDDEKGSLEITSGILEDAGYMVYKALKPIDGINKAFETIPDLIVLDWYMPQMDGLQVLRKLKENNAVKEIPVVMATGIKTESEDLKLALDAGAVDFIRKPIDEVELLARVKAALRLAHYYSENREQLRIIFRQEKKMMKQKADEYKKELDYKKQELINNALQLLQIMENTTDMVGDLKKLNLHLDDDNSAKLNTVIAKYQTSSFQKRWAEFEKRFEEIHTEFYLGLLKDFPSLSANERKLCVYFKMDMENKDIAAITFSSYDAVRKSRQRLKKKLGLKADASLIGFLNHY